MDKILLGTTNPGKAKEMKNYLSVLDVEILTLDGINQEIEEPNEPHENIEENAFLKARYYAQKTELATLSDDGGLFVDAFDGWPGVRSARVADTSQERRKIILDMLEKKDTDNRSASFRTVIFFYDPIQNSSFSAMGVTQGKITDKPKSNPQAGFGYDPIFHVNKAGKTYAAMTTKEKNEVSHRGKALRKTGRFLKNNY